MEYLLHIPYAEKSFSLTNYIFIDFETQLGSEISDMCWFSKSKNSSWNIFVVRNVPKSCSNDKTFSVSNERLQKRYIVFRKFLFLHFYQNATHMS